MAILKFNIFQDFSRSAGTLFQIFHGWPYLYSYSALRTQSYTHSGLPLSKFRYRRNIINLRMLMHNNANILIIKINVDSPVLKKHKSVKIPQYASIERIEVALY